MSKFRQKFISETLFNKLKKILESEFVLTRKGLCNICDLFKYSTLKNADSYGYDCIKPSGFNGKSDLYDPQRIIAFIERNYLILREEDIEAGDFSNPLNAAIYKKAQEKIKAEKAARRVTK